jgi:hypothetical protein
VGVVHWQVVHDRKILQENKKQDRKTGRRISMVNSINRYLGLASGLDTESIVSGMMVAHRIPVDKLEQEKQKLEWQQEDYRSLNKSLYEFRDQVFDMKLESTFNSRLATSSNENAAVVKAGSNALEGSYMITVNQLASGVSKASASALAASKNSNGKTLTLFDQFSSLSDRGFTENDTIKVKINGTELSFDLGQDNIYTMVEKINQSDLGVRAVYDSGSNRFFLNTTATGVNSQIVITEDDSNFFSNGEFNSILKLNIDQDVVYQGQNEHFNCPLSSPYLCIYPPLFQVALFLLTESPCFAHYFVNNPIFHRFFGGHEIISFRILLYFFQGLAGSIRHNPVQRFSHSNNSFGMNLNVCSLTLSPATRLMNHYFGIG